LATKQNQIKAILTFSSSSLVGHLILSPHRPGKKFSLEKQKKKKKSFAEASADVKL
jgi:hypothetical protein